MRRELFICSVLMAASLLTSCGYDDGKEEAVVEEFLPSLSKNCTSTFDCKVGTSIVGECISGSCQRFCDSYDDCETNTICESGICRPIVDCPSLTFQETVALEGASISNAGASEAYAGKKCVQVFSHAPSDAWRAVSLGDVVLDSKMVEEDSKTDFTSDDFTFVLPYNSTFSGLGFSLTTFVALVYLTMLEHTYVDVAECIQPKILKKDESNQNSYVLMDEVIDGFIYAASYRVNVSDTSLNDMNAITQLCGKSVQGMNSDMEQYLKYYKIDQNEMGTQDYWESDAFLTEEEFNQYASLIEDLDEAEREKYKCNPGECPEEKPDDPNAKIYKYKIKHKELLTLAVQDYAQMISSDAQCVRAMTNLSILSKISGILMQMVNSGTSSSTADAASELAALFKTMDAEVNYYKKLVEIGSEILDLQSISICNQNVFNKTMNINRSVYNQYDKTNADYTQDERYLKYCNHETMGCSDMTTCDYNSAMAMNATYEMMLFRPMLNMIYPCNYSLLGVSRFPLTMSLTSSDDMKIGICSDHNNVVSAMINKSKLSAPNLIMPQIITTLFKSSGENSYENLGPVTIFDKFLDPSYLWLSGQSYMGLKIRVAENSDFSTNDLIFENRFKPLEEMFAMTTVPAIDDDGNPVMEGNTQVNDQDTHPLTTDVRIDVFSDAYAKESIDQETGMPYVIATPPKAESSTTNYISSYDYKKADMAKTVSGTALYQKHGKAETCPNNVCTLYHYAHKTGKDASGMICGGISYNLEQFNGYIVLTDTDLTERAGKRKIEAESVSK